MTQASPAAREGAQSRTVLSDEHVANDRPWGSQATHHTRSPCPTNVASCVRCTASLTPSQPPSAAAEEVVVVAGAGDGGAASVPPPSAPRPRPRNESMIQAATGDTPRHLADAEDECTLQPNDARRTGCLAEEVMTRGGRKKKMLLTTLLTGSDDVDW